MICPFCQTDLDAKDLVCPRCGAAISGGGTMALGFRLRTLAVVGVLMIVLALVVVTCIAPRLPGGDGGTGIYRSLDAQRVLQDLARHQQGNQNPPPQPAIK